MTNPTTPSILIVMRHANMRRVHPGMMLLNCRRCYEVVGLYPSGQRVLQTRPTTELVCEVCHDPTVRAVLAPGALEENSESVPAPDPIKGG